jgi:protein-S-isoprenylcysteine O-methyltransferase Ste14
MGNLQNKAVSTQSLLFKTLITFLATIALIFIFAGTITYWQGWVFAVFYSVVAILTTGQYLRRKDLVSERINPGPGVKRWDRIIFKIFTLLCMAVIALSSLDAGRFGWSPKLPVIVYVVSNAVMYISYSFIIWAMFTNNFFSSRVRIQTDRGQYVVQQGPYSIVRHPGYLGVLFWLPSQALTLGSLWGLIPAGLAVITIIIRTYLEDKMLRQELSGYIEYTQKVRYRLIPGIW